VTLRGDHVVGAAVIVIGLIIWAVSGDLPTGRLSMPGAGMMPKLLCALMIFFGLMLILRAGDSAPFAEISWGDIAHAAPVMAITVVAVALYTTIGFILSMGLMLFALLCLERRNLVAAAAYSAGVSVATYFLFTVVLKSPLEQGLLPF
jgi:hypothetical protein